MQTNAFKQGLRAGEVQLGLWLSLCSNYAADIVADIGYDWLLLDMEHAPSGVPVVLQQLQALAHWGSTPIVRPAWNDQVMVKRLLDLGAPGLLFPMVQSADEARAAVAACRYPPGGLRGVGGPVRANRYGRDTDYDGQVEQETCILVQVETREALDRIDEIAAVDGVDGVFFGPSDISASLGMLGRITDEVLWQEISKAARKVQAQGKPVGTITPTQDLTERVLDEGFLFVALSSDHMILAQGAEALLARNR